METLRAVVELLGEELRKSRPVLANTLPGNNRDRVAAKLLENPEDEVMQARVDLACHYYVQHLRWFALSPEEAFFVHERMEEAVRFGHWLTKSKMRIGKADARYWLEFLLIEYWNFLGNTYWRERTRDRSGLL
jgi:hypothetical protein